jgi:hypothetical protein
MAALPVSTAASHQMPILGIFMPNMGIQANPKTPPSSLADALFSGTRQRLIGLLFGQVGRSVGADAKVSHRADPNLSQGWTPSGGRSSVDKCRSSAVC